MIKGGDLHGRQARAGKVAIIPADHMRARLHGFRYRVARAQSVIEEAAQLGNVGVSYSGGKDSTVLLDLVRQVIPGAPAGFFDSGCELCQTYEIVRHYGVEIVKPKMGLLEMCRHGGYWGYKHPVDPDAEFNFGQVLIDEPAQRFAEAHDLAVQAMGLRAEESGTRQINAAQRGELYFAEYTKLWHLYPLQWWTADDIWAYIASRGLRYNGAYDIMTQIGLPRDQQRISTLLGSAAARTGRYAILKRIDPGLWNRLAAEFPKVRAYV
jgi:phosphoadenosine phosphosulfate reductase